MTGRAGGAVGPETGHPAADDFNVHFRLGNGGREMAAVHDRDAVADLEEFVDFLGNDEHGRAVLAQAHQRVADRGGGADVDAPGGLIDDEHARILKNLAAHDELLQIAAREAARMLLRGRGLHVEALDDLLREAQGLLLENEAVLHEVVAREIGVRLERDFGHGGVAEALLGHVA